ncbi:MAG: hypothetical protein ABI614_27145 [Planctomycetota bacterium]
MNPLTPTEDIRAARHKLAAKFNNDLDQIVADLQRQQVESDAEFIALPSRVPKRTTNNSIGGGRRKRDSSN